jgi:methionine synthase I (cobalamin-dependent)
MKISKRCKAKHLKAITYEDMIWSACKSIILNQTAILPAEKGFYEHLFGETQNLSEERNQLQLEMQEINEKYNRALQLFVHQGGNLEVIETELDRLNKQKSQLEYKIAKID